MKRRKIHSSGEIEGRSYSDFVQQLLDANNREKSFLNQLLDANKREENYLNQLFETNERKKALTVINSFAIDLLAATTESEIVWLVAKKAIALLGFPDCVVYLYDADEGHLYQAAAHGPKNIVDLDIADPITIKLGEGIVGSVAKSLEPEIVNDTSIDERYIVDDAVRYSEIAVPLYYGETLIGVIDSEHEEKNFFKEFDLNTLKTIASLVSTKIVETRAVNINRKLADIVANTDDAIVTFDLEGYITSWNSGAYKMFGWSEEEVYAQTVEFFTPMEDMQKSMEIFSQVIQEKRQITYECKRIQKSGGTIEMSVSIFPLFDGINSVHGVSAIMRDISERKAAQKNVEVTFKKLQQAQALARIGSWEFSIASGEFQCSHELYRILGLDPSGGLNYELYMSRVAPEDRKRFQVYFKQAMESTDESFIIHRINDENDPEVYVECRGSVDLNEAGEPVRLFGTCMNVSDRIKAQKIQSEFTEKLEQQVSRRTEELEIYQNELKYQLETLDVAGNVVIFNTNKKISHANDQFCRYIGYSREELIGQEIFKFKSDKISVEDMVFLLDTLNKGRTWSGEFIYSSKEGDSLYLHTTIVPFLNIQGEVEKFVSIGFDVTKEKELRSQLEDALMKEKELGELKSQFVSSASHQFRTPMAIIQSNSELMGMLIDENADQEEREKFHVALKRINNQIKRMTDLMDEVFILGKLGAGRIEAKKKPTEIEPMILDLINHFSSIQPDGRKVDYTTMGEPRLLNIDLQLLDHSLSNLISNAFKYSEELNPKLNVNYKEEGVEITVKDYGIGMSQEDLKNIFLPFHRADNVANIEGTGLGLTIVKEYVELNDGEIEVQSELKQGSTFSIKLRY